MIACKQVAKALSKKRYYEMSRWRRVLMFWHIRLCPMCGKYHQQVVDMQEGVKNYLDYEKNSDDFPEEKLSDDAKKRMIEALEKAS